jgi:hypothetical protein
MTRAERRSLQQLRAHPYRRQASDLLVRACCIAADAGAYDYAADLLRVIEAVDAAVLPKSWNSNFSFQHRSRLVHGRR